MTLWQPGVTYNGGIPARSTQYGSALSPLGGGQNDTTQIQNALNACTSGQHVKLNSGTFQINTGTYIQIPSNVTLRGNGVGNTILYKSDGATPNSGSPGYSQSPVVLIGPSRWGIDADTSSNLTADAVKGEYHVHVTSATGFSVGDIVILDEYSGSAWRTDPGGRGSVWASSDYRVIWRFHNPGIQYVDDPLNATTPTTGDAASWFCRQDRPTSEIKRISDINGTTITFDTPIHISYRTSHTAQLSNYTVTHTVAAGLENLTLRGGDDGNIRFIAAADCWAKNIESYQWLNEGIACNFSYRCEVRDSYLHDACWAQPGGGGYALSLSGGTSEFLFENSISCRANKVMVSRCSGAGSVVGYNYVDQGYINNNGSWDEIGLNGSHMVGPHHMLFEGNYGWNADSDDTHGNSIYHTYFRNHLRGVRTSHQYYDIGTGSNQNTSEGGPLRCAGLMTGSYWHSFVGNVMGASGQMSGWSYEVNGAFAGNAIWKLGWDGMNPYPVDTVITTDTSKGVLRDGNYDYVTNSQRWHGVGGDPGDGTAATLPASLYLSAAPAFMSGYTWPWVEPGGSTKLYTLPAKERFEAL